MDYNGGVYERSHIFILDFPNECESNGDDAIPMGDNPGES